MRLRGLAILTALALSGCNGGNNNQMSDAATGPSMDGGTQADAAPDLGDNGQPSTMYPAPHPDAPQVVNAGGPVLTTPVIIPVFFSNDDATQKAALEDFLSKLGATNYWTTATKEYGVGAATATTPVELTETATGTIDDSAIQTWLAGKLNSDDPSFPAPTANSVYALHYPSVVTITLQGGMMGTAQSCQTFGGYHQSITLDAKHGSMKVAYAVIPRCSGIHGLSTLETTTGAESHELIEASTDPYPEVTPAYGQVDDDHLYWMFGLGGGEVGDLCAQDPSAFTKFPELDDVVQRSWSNASAKAGHDPCVPELANEVYFNAAPELNDTITIGGAYTMKGVQVPVGTSKTIDLDLFSDGDTGGPWTVKVEDLSAKMGGGSTNLQLSLDRTTGQNGEKLHLTIKTLAAGQYGAGIFAVVSTLAGQSHFWLGLVGEQ